MSKIIERREMLTPIFDEWEEILGATPQAKLDMLEKRFYTPLLASSDHHTIVYGGCVQDCTDCSSSTMEYLYSDIHRRIYISPPAVKDGVGHQIKKVQQ